MSRQVMLPISKDMLPTPQHVFPCLQVDYFSGQKKNRQHPMVGVRKSRILFDPLGPDNLAPAKVPSASGSTPSPAGSGRAGFSVSGADQAKLV